MSSMMVKGVFERNIRGGFKESVNEIHIEGDISIEGLEDRAVGYCYIHNTLRKAVLMAIELYLSGDHVVTRTARPEA